MAAKSEVPTMDGNGEGKQSSPEAKTDKTESGSARGGDDEAVAAAASAPREQSPDATPSEAAKVEGPAAIDGAGPGRREDAATDPAESDGRGATDASDPAVPSSPVQGNGEGGVPDEPVAVPSTTATPPRPSRAGPFALAVSVLALLGAGLVGWQVYELRMLAKETRQEVAQRLATADGAAGEIRALTRQNQESVAALQGRFGALESQVSASAGQAAALEALYMEFSRSRADQVLAEVEQAINIAAQQLQLAGNFEAALIALRGAEARLAMPDQGHLQTLRKALIADIDTLTAHPQVDVSGLALRLEILLDRIDALPLAFEVQFARIEEEREEVERRYEVEGDHLARAFGFARALAADVWGEVRGMVRLERMDQADPVLLAPAQSAYLRENVKIRLLTARLALLARDGKTYSTDLAQARDWIERYFHREDEQVARVLHDLGELEQTPITAEQPTLTETFAALRLVQARSSTGRPSGGESR